MDRDLPKDESDCNGLCTDRMEAVEEQSQVPPSLAAIMSTIYAHQHNIQQIEVKLKELLQNQQVLTEGLRGENERFKEAETTFNLPALFSEVCVYTQKLAYLREEMNNITDRTARLKEVVLKVAGDSELVRGLEWRAESLSKTGCRELEGGCEQGEWIRGESGELNDP
nr:uncharacterized protein LOC123771474 isoform X2 [Procambarus clarkii]XP_045619986.1 uncharacterized protein LOC123771474 isoform X2 [Procambarus clarkii]XP_045619987.1 uncharacterized protein LOC123771474 isoform X2 [Procambarus clarkii]XP_045619989.1 uncharacterized protein LOC123771474 isoform X2 [Procambarus clarkii]